MSIHIALAGNPNSGKTTLFNALTGSHQYVGNWPGVTVEKKTGSYKKDEDIKFTDLPGIYSLSPYTLEEVVSRDFLLNGEADVIIDVIDASNIERNLYLATQLSELGIPLVLAFNMMDVVRKNKDKIDCSKIERELNCKVVEISALKNEGIDKLIEVAKLEALRSKKDIKINTFSERVESYLKEIEEIVASIKEDPAKRWFAIKLFEKDEKISDNIYISKKEKEYVDAIINRAEEEFDDDTEGIITDERYNFVSEITQKSVKKGRRGLSTSDKIDKIVTNRILALPIFVGIMFLIYYVAMTYVGGPVTDWVNDNFFGEVIGGNVQAFLEGIGTANWLTSLIVDGIIGGVGGVLGFLPVIATLFLFISILEDVGYMARIAFILDRIFRRFGLSGKSFIPILMGTGCSVPGIMGTRTIESDRDRRMTIIVASFMPCGAKTDIIVMFSAVLGGHFWYGPLWYFGGIAAVVISGIILKKTRRFKGDPAPFVMELPEYHLPAATNILKATWHRCKAFIVKAGTVILLCTIVIWFLQNISINFEFVEFAEASTDSILSFIGKKLSWIFVPLGFGDWMATVATILGLVAKEVVVGTYGVVAGIGEVGADDPGLIPLIQQNFTTASILSFMFFNQLTIPCFAALGAIKEEMGSKKWFGFAIGYQVVFSYTMALMIYQFARVFIEGQPVNAWTFIAAVVLIIYLYLLFRPAEKKDRLNVRSAEV
ncbi:ferrous iron transport protein B [Peptoniphilus sp. ING2-D1G]|nr:ferrous iron transport protein B [Peptoniphilus sp. ING2-D1G]